MYLIKTTSIRQGIYLLSNVAISNQKHNIEIMSETDIVSASYAVCLNVSAELAVHVFPVAMEKREIVQKHITCRQSDNSLINVMILSKFHLN